MGNENVRRDPEEASVDTGLEGVCADEKHAGIIREEEVEGGEELSIGGGPPSGAGGTRDSPAPTREDLREP